jgi:hypothetical protein
MDNKELDDAFNYTDKDIIAFFKKEYGIHKIRKREYLDRRDYVIGILYHKYSYTESEISALFPIDRSSVNRIKNKCHDYLYVIKDEKFVHNVRKLINKFPYNFKKRSTGMINKLDTLVLLDFDTDHYCRLNMLARERNVNEEDVAKHLLYDALKKLKP